MKRFTGIILPVLLTMALVFSPAILEAQGGRSGGHGGGGGSHGGSHGGFSHGHGGHGFHGSTFFGFGAGFLTGYAIPWGYPYYYYPAYYPGYYPGYYSSEYYYAPPVSYSAPAYQEPPPGYFESAPGPQSSGDRTYTSSPENFIPPSANQRRCQKWMPTGESHTESRWNPQTQMMESVTVPNYAWQDYPCK